MSPLERLETEAAIARAVAANVTDVLEGEWGKREWLHLFVDFEVDDLGERSSSTTFALARSPGQPMEKVAFRLSRDAKRLFGVLADGMGDSPNRRWTNAQLRVAWDGGYTLNYAYGPPYRLGGNLIDKRFDDYLEHWLASDEGISCNRPARRWWQRLIGRCKCAFIVWRLEV